MALVGQIVTVSDVLMDGAVNNYIMGADANVFQTNYNSSGVMTNWSIGNISKVGIYGTNSATNSLILNVPTYQIQMDDSSMSIGPKTGSNYIYYSGNSRPYFGTCASNYIVGNNDLSHGLEHHNHTSLHGENTYSHLSLSIGNNMLGHEIVLFDTVNGHTFNPGRFSYHLSSIQGWNESGSEGTNITATSTEGSLYHAAGSTGNNHWFYVTNSYAQVGGDTFYINCNYVHNLSQGASWAFSGLYNFGISTLNTGFYMDNPGDGSISFHGSKTFSNAIRYVATPGVGNLPIYVGSQDEIICTGGSSRRLKKDITSIIDDKFNPSLLYNLKLNQFKYKEDPTNTTVVGFIAEEVEEIYPCASVYHYDENNNKIIDNWEVRYIVPPMLKLIQDQHKEIETLKTEIAEIKELLKNK